jgi:hypothetical protein
MFCWLSDDSLPLQCHDVNVPMVKYSFVQLSALEELPKDSTCGKSVPGHFPPISKPL